MSIDGGAPVTRSIELPPAGKVIALVIARPRVAGLDHRFVRRAA
jgi:hypothetical protein